jgi:hypothetical protein
MLASSIVIYLIITASGRSFGAKMELFPKWGQSGLAQFPLFTPGYVQSDPISLQISFGRFARRRLQQPLSVLKIPFRVFSSIMLKAPSDIDYESADLFHVSMCGFRVGGGQVDPIWHQTSRAPDPML